MRNLPKRNDKNFKEIEEFGYYELTNCIAYEMAIRNDNIKEAIEKSVIIKNEKNCIFKDKKLHGLENYFDNIIVRKDEKEKKVDYIELLQEHGFDYFELLQHILQSKESFLYTDLHNHNLEDILDKYELDLVCTIERTVWNSIEYTNVENDIIETNEEFLTKYLTSLDWVFTEPSEEIIKDALKRKQKINIINHFSRPTLKPKGTKSLSIDINPSIPKDEILAYISKIKDEYDKDNSKIQSPLELLGENLEKSDNKISKKKLADKFFVYDYVKMRLKQIEELNKGEKEAIENNIKDVEDNIYLSGMDKKIQIEVLKQEHKENLIDTKIDDIFREKELCNVISSGTAKRYYYDMKPYIDDRKYKELITGVAN